MKICAVICEYNPFHNGHKYQLEQIRKQTACDAVLCLMSGNFTQRGDIALFDKFTRAKHAVENGADLVLELPALFSVAPAELFAKGAVHILSSIPEVTALAFGCESGTSEDFLAAAKATNSEDKAFHALLKERLKGGVFYGKAKTQTLLSLHEELSPKLFSLPNNLLGVEYCRALILAKSGIRPIAIPRVGQGYADETLAGEYSSAAAIRSALTEGTPKQMRLIKNNLPGNVFSSLPSLRKTAYKPAALCALLSAKPETLSRCTDCSEGLENRLLSVVRGTPEFDEALQKIVSKRYTLSRIKRLVAQNFLCLSQKALREALSSPLYYKVLCVKAEKKEALFRALGRGKFPLLARKSDESALSRTALNCFSLDVSAAEKYNVLSERFTNPHETLFVP